MNNKIEQLHLEAIDTNIFPYQLCNDDDPINIGGKDKAASKSAEITEQIAIEFARWCDKKELSDNYMTWEDWFDEFLKTKQ